MVDRVPAALIVVVSVALSVVLSSLLQGPGTRPGPGTAVGLDGLGASLAELEARIEALEQRPDPIRVETESALSPREPVEHPEGTQAMLAHLAERLDRLEGRSARDPRSRDPVALVMERAQREAAAKRDEAEQTIAWAQGVILDPSATPDEKVKAQKRLRRVPDAYTPEMVQELLRVAHSDSKGERRAEVWALFDGSSHLPELVPTLLTSLQYDTSAAARNEASETLGNYADHPGVVQALRFAAENDLDEGVRRKALRTLRELGQTPPR